MTQVKQVLRFSIENGPPLWGLRGIIFSLAVDNFSVSQPRPMIIPDEFRRWVNFNLTAKGGASGTFEAVIQTVGRKDDIWDEIWHIAGKGRFLPTLRRIMDGVREDPLSGFRGEYNVRSRKGWLEVFDPNVKETSSRELPAYWVTKTPTVEELRSATSKGDMVEFWVSPPNDDKVGAISCAIIDFRVGEPFTVIHAEYETEEGRVRTKHTATIYCNLRTGLGWMYNSPTLFHCEQSKGG